MRRELGQAGLADGPLERIAALVDRTASDRLPGAIDAAPVGRPSDGPLVLLKRLLLPPWYRLSGPALEEALADRLCPSAAPSGWRAPTRCPTTRPGPVSGAS